MVSMLPRSLSPQEEQDVHTQLALFWKDRTQQERNAYANVLVFLVLTSEDPVAPAAFEVIVHDIIKNPSTPLPFSVEPDEDFRDTVAMAVMEKLRAAGASGDKKEARPWRRLVAYQHDHDLANGNFRAWLKLVAYRTAVDLLRKHPQSIGSRRARRWLRCVSLDEWDAGADAMEQWYNETPLPVRLDVLRTLVATAEWLQDLSEEDRQVLCLRVDAELGYQEIAGRVSSTADAVRKRIVRLRRRLRAHLDESC